MTAAELDKARDWRRKRGIRDDKMLSGTRIDELIVTYGAAQYEAGAASMRERAEAIASDDDNPHRSSAVAAAIWALPLREKEG